jgi:hypothetical protein
MIHFTVEWGDLDRIADQLARFSAGAFDLAPLARKIGDILEVDNMQARMSGVDYDGNPFQPLAPATLRHRSGSGPPLAPMDMASRVIGGMEVEVVEYGLGSVEVVASWPSMPFLKFHVTGTRHMPARDPVGLRPVAWAQVADAVTEFVDGLGAGE